MKKLSPIETNAISGLFFASGFLLSFVGGCTAKRIYQARNNDPVWLNSVVVAMFIGSFLCCAGCMGLLDSRKHYTQSWCYVVWGSYLVSVLSHSLPIMGPTIALIFIFPLENRVYGSELLMVL
jgi:hypothetical protein